MTSTTQNRASIDESRNEIYRLICNRLATWHMLGEPAYDREVAERLYFQKAAIERIIERRRQRLLASTTGEE